MIHTVRLNSRLVLAVVADVAEKEDRSEPARSRNSALARRCGCEAMKSVIIPSSTEVAPDIIGRGPLGEPLFPVPFKGSLAHTLGWACALVTNDPELVSVGVDIEAVERPFRPEVALRIASQSEREALSAWRHNPTLPSYWRSGLALFCAKEAVLKALSPVIQQHPVLSQLSLTCDPAANRFDLSATAIFAQPIHGSIMAFNGALITYAVAPR